MKVIFNKKKSSIAYPQLNIKKEYADEVNKLFRKYKGLPAVEF